MSFNKVKLLEKLYGERLPDIYRKYDSMQLPISQPLKRFLQVGDSGFDYLQNKIEGVFNLYDIDRCPPEFLPYLAGMVGFEFPYDMPDAERRAFLKALPTLYKNKGNKLLFGYLGRIIFGNDTTVGVTRFNPDAEHNYNYIELQVDVNGDTSDLNKRTDKYRAFAEKFRPVNHKLNVLLRLMYYDDYDFSQMDDDEKQKIFEIMDDFYDLSTLASDVNSEKIFLTETDVYDPAIILETINDLAKETSEDTYDVQPVDTEGTAVLKHTETDSYDSSVIVDSLDKELLLNTEEDAYNGISSNLVADDLSDLTKVDDAEIYDAVKSDSSQDKIINLGSFLGDTRDTGLLGAGFLFGADSTEQLLSENNI